MNVALWDEASHVWFCRADTVMDFFFLHSRLKVVQNLISEAISLDPDVRAQTPNPHEAHAAPTPAPLGINELQV